MPLRVIREAVLEALVEGQPLPRVIALFEAAAAETNRAVFDGLARSPGALFRWVFRRNWRAPRRTGPTTGKLAQAPESACAPASPRVAASSLPQDPAQQLAAGEGVEIASVPGENEGRQREQLLDPDEGRRIAAMLREWRQTLGATVPA